MHESQSAKVAVISGGGGGIGSACARRLAVEGYTTVLLGRSSSPLEQVRDGIIQQFGTECQCVVADVRDWDRLCEVEATLSERYGRVDVLINSAGGQFHALVDEMTTNGWNAVVETNLTGTYLMCQATGALLREARGSVVNVVANVWQRAAPRMAHSGAARAGVVSLTRTLAIEWAPFQVRVNALSPGVTDTPGLRRREPDLSGKSVRIPLGRIATSDEIAEAAWFLAGPSSSYVTGEVLVVDGGLQLA